MCSETSPRISFSNDLSQEDDIPVDRRDTTLLESSCDDFEFSICSSIGHEESSLADDLFADGMILPVKVPETKFSPLNNQMHTYDQLPRKVPLLPPLPSPSTNGNRYSKKEIIVSNSESEEKTQSNKSFWGFKRSSSLNCDIKKSLCSLPLLSRSNSTGSVPNPKQKQSSSSKDIVKNNSQTKQQLYRKLSSSQSGSSTSNTYVYTLPNKPPLKKNYGGSHGNSTINGVKFSPVLNVPPPSYIAKGAANLFGLGSFLRNGREKSRK